MFKLGLLEQAKIDFKECLDNYPREIFSHFNYALCLFQLGDYHNSNRIIDEATKLILDEQTVKKDKIDYILLNDAFQLKAQSLWRIEEPLEAVKNFWQATRFETEGKQDCKSKKLNWTQLRNKLADLTIKEIKRDMIEDYDLYMVQRSKSARYQICPDKYFQKEFERANAAQNKTKAI